MRTLSPPFSIYAIVLIAVIYLCSVSLKAQIETINLPNNNGWGGTLGMDILHAEAERVGDLGDTHLGNDIAEGPHDIDDLHASRASGNTRPAGGAGPDLLILKFGQTQLGLVHHPSD